MTAKLREWGIGIPTIITWLILLAQGLFFGYKLYFNLESHISNDVMHLSKIERSSMQAQINKIENELGVRDLKVKEIVRQTVKELKEEGYLK